MGQFTGPTVEAAIEEGLKALGISRLQARIKVLSREKKGFFGLFKKPAIVEVARLEEASEEKPTKPKPVLVEPDKLTEARQKKVAEAASLSLEKEESKTPQSESPKELSEAVEKTQPDIQEAAQAVSDYVQTIIYEMDLEATIAMTTNRRAITLQIETSEPGRVIGYHGKVLKSLQLLAQNFLHDRYSKYFAVSLNVNDYIEHRTETLIDFARKISERVLETGRDYTMDPMTNSERKTVHKTISQIDGVTSYSEGSDPNRYVVVTLQ